MGTSEEEDRRRIRTAIRSFNLRSTSATVKLGSPFLQQAKNKRQHAREKTARAGRKLTDDS